MADDDKIDGVKERLTRMEERLIAEKSVRKTRDDQLFKFISQVHSDMEKQEKALGNISSDVGEVSSTLSRVEETLRNQNTTIEKAGKNSQENRDSIKEIQGSVKMLKWVWPLLISLAAGAVSLYIANTDLKIEKANGDPDSQVVGKPSTD